MPYFCLFFAIAVLSVERGFADTKLDEKTVINFASVEQGRKILASRDHFVERLSLFDRASRLKTDKEVSEGAYLEFVAKNVLEWSEREKKHVSGVISAISPRLKEMALPWPENILLIKTTGKEEGDAAYTRANAIVLPKSMVSSSRKRELEKMVCHELFHILTRKNPELREKLYQAIGFQKCKELDFPTKYAEQKITNPDAPLNDHCIKLKAAGETVWAMPILYSASKYDARRGGDFFEYLICQYVVVAKGNTSLPDDIVYDKDKPRLLETNEVSGLYEQVGKNSGYLIHPEEVLADNFALLLQGEKRVPSPEILDKMKALLDKYSRRHSDQPK